MAAKVAKTGIKRESGFLYYLDKKGEKDVPIEAKEVVIETSFDDAAPLESALSPVDPSDSDPPAASRFEKKLKDLIDAIEGGADATVKFTVGDKSYQGKLVHEH